MKNEQRVRATVEIVKAYLEQNQVDYSELADLIEAIGDSLAETDGAETGTVVRTVPPREAEQPAVRTVALRHQRKSRQPGPLVTRH